MTAENTGSYWSQNREQSVQLDVVAANPPEKKLFIGEAKWGADGISRNLLTDFSKRSRRMPQVEQDWNVQHGLSLRGNVTNATEQAARELWVRFLTLKQLKSEWIGRENVVIKRECCRLQRPYP